MSSNFWLTEEQFNKIRLLLPNKPRGVPPVDDRHVLSGILFCIQRGYRWPDVPAEYAPAKTLYNRWKRWSEAGVFERVFDTLARETVDLSTLMIDSSHVKTHRIAANGVKKHLRWTADRQDQRRTEFKAAFGLRWQWLSGPFAPDGRQSGRYFSGTSVS